MSNSGDPKMLPKGVTFIDMRHHSEPSPIERMVADILELRERVAAVDRLTAENRGERIKFLSSGSLVNPD